jgi:uncharacterized protein (DUF433 family)
MVRHLDESVAGVAQIAGFDGSHKTIVKYLKREGQFSVVKAKVPKLTEAQVQSRLRFVDLHLRKELEHWKSLTFSDESCFYCKVTPLDLSISRFQIISNVKHIFSKLIYFDNQFLLNTNFGNTSSDHTEPKRLLV